MAEVAGTAVGRLVRGRSLVLVLALASLTTGCISGLQRSIDESRDDDVQESVGEGTDTGEDISNVTSRLDGDPVPPSPATTTVAPVVEPTPTATTTVPTPTPTPVVTPTPTPSPTPTVSTTTPTPAPTPTTTTTPTPTPTPTPTTTPTPTQPTPQAWPHEGSFVKYRISSGSSCPDGCWFQHEEANASWTYRNGDWTGTCDAQVTEWWRDNNTYHNYTRHVTYTAANPPHWPLFNTRSPPAEGEPVTGWYMDNGCGIGHNDHDFLYDGTSSQMVPVNGVDTPLATHRAVTPDDGVPRDHRTEWLQGSGLVVYAYMQWHYSRASTELMDTDAPR